MPRTTTPSPPSGPARRLHGERRSGHGEGGQESTFSAQAAPGARFTGEVVRTDGSALPAFLDGDVRDLQEHSLGSLVWDGTSLHSTALPPGDYRLVLHDPNAIRHFWYDGIELETEATVLHVARGEQKAVTFHVPPSSPTMRLTLQVAKDPGGFTSGPFSLAVAPRGRKRGSRDGP
jgi:hypothetical protein